MGLKPGMRVLDVGCGVGGPAREIARFSGAHVTGVNNNQFQVERARKYTAKAGLSDQVDFVKGDFMGLSELFGANSFDAVYAIEATVHAPNFEGIYGEIKKVLKPGGVVSKCLTLGQSCFVAEEAYEGLIYSPSSVRRLRVVHDGCIR